MQVDQTTSYILPTMYESTDSYFFRERVLIDLTIFHSCLTLQVGLVHVHECTCGGSSNTERRAFHASLRVAPSGPEAVVCIRLQVCHRQPAPRGSTAVQHRVAVWRWEETKDRGLHLVHATGFMTSFTVHFLLCIHTHSRIRKGKKH